jgi:hypothetical protein
MNQKFDFKDITIVPEIISSINSRNEVNIFTEENKLPIIVSPMDTVVDEDNCDVFIKQNLLVCLPRGVNHDNKDNFNSLSLDEFEVFVGWYEDNIIDDDINILVDVANGHMEKLHNLCEKFVNLKNENHKLMVGNIANPKTFEKFCQIGVDYVRTGIGGGSGCLTSVHTGIHYPMASLISECYEIKKLGGYKTKIVADGGFKNYDDIIKALALGADYIMLGGTLNKSLESWSKTNLFKIIPISHEMANKIWNNYPFLRKYMTKKFRGMSTKDVQRKWGKTKITTSEGITKTNKIEYKLDSWIENFSDYLKSAMSYTNSKTLEEFKESRTVFISENALKRYTK